MADCSAAGTTIDRAARAVLGGAGAASAASTASKHVGALLGHASMLSATTNASNVAAVAAGSMPMVAPDHLVMPGARLTPLAQEPMIQHPAGGAATVISSPQLLQQQQQQQHPLAMHHPVASSGPQTLAPSMYHQHQLQHHHQHQQQQFQMQMQFQMQQQQQQQQVMAMMLHQQQQQQQFHKQKQQQQQQQQQQHLEQPNVAQQQSNNVEDSFREREQMGGDWIDDVIHDVPEGADIDELARAWSRAEAEYDSVLLDHELQQRLEEGEANEHEYEYANMWQGGNNDNLQPLAQQQEPRPYEFINSVAAGTDVDTAASATVDYMEKGMEQFRAGNIKEAIASFEMELQLRNSDNATAWRMLGRCHAENDQDPEAIQCLEAAVDRDPFCPEALLALGVSYVNELNHERALENMKAWFTHNPKYAGLEFSMPSESRGGSSATTRTRTRTAEEDIYGAAPEAEASADSNLDLDPDDITASHRSTKETAFDEVKSMLLAALEFDPTDAGDVYEALGVIYNVIKDYDSAADAFLRALESRPDTKTEDYQLWNKLGATLANGNQSDRALPMYSRSLQIKPRYARAWLNMAISHSNLQDHDEAARCYLQTLSLNPAATHCWTYLRMSLSSKERWDLLPFVFERNLAGFQEHFDFVLYD